MDYGEMRKCIMNRYYKKVFKRKLKTKESLLTIVPEWSKGVDLRSTTRKCAWVRTPSMV